jgi:hypothetical protein
MVRLTPDEDRLLIAFARVSGLPPAVYARRRLLSEPIPNRPLVAATDTLLHANRAALACAGVATELASRGDNDFSHRLQTAVLEIELFVRELTATLSTGNDDRKGQ